MKNVNDKVLDFMVVWSIPFLLVATPLSFVVGILIGISN